MADDQKPKKKAPAVPQPPDPMQAIGKAKTIGAPQGPWTPLPSPGDAPLSQLMHGVLGNARVVSGPGGRSPATSGPADMMGLVGGGEGAASEGPIARFIGWMRGVPEQGIPHVPLYNVEAPGHPLDMSTVHPSTLDAHGIPYTPPPPNRWGSDIFTDAQGMQVPSDYFNKAPQAAAPAPQPPASQAPLRQPYVPPGMATKAQQMGDATMGNLRDAGYNVPPGGSLRTRGQLDALVNTPPDPQKRYNNAFRSDDKLKAVESDPKFADRVSGLRKKVQDRMAGSKEPSDPRPHVSKR